MPNPLPFDRLLRQAATHYRQFYPGEEVRLGRGLEIALNNGVQTGWTTLNIYYEVASASNIEVRYIVAGRHCDCPDFQKAPGGRCKHRWAVFLTRIAQAMEDLADHEER